MAKYVNILFLFAFAIIVANANAQVPQIPSIPGILPGPLAGIVAIRINGLLICALPGPLPTGPPLVGVNVTVSCDGGQTTLGQAITDQNGVFVLLIRAVTLVRLFLREFFGGQNSVCAVYAKVTPILNCTLLPANQVLRAPLNISGIVGIIRGLLGLVLHIVAGLFVIY